MRAVERRRGMKSGGGLPYDAEVEYLESTGTQYIDSGIECTGDLIVEFEGLVRTNENIAACGGIKAGPPHFRHHFSPYESSVQLSFYYIQYNSDAQCSISLQKSSPVNIWYNVRIDPTNGTAVVNNTNKTFTSVSGSQTTGKSYGIFARIQNNGSLQSRKCAFKYFKMWRNGVLLRDYIPVRKGQVGYMYDRVSGTLFGNAGTGNFVLGNDKNS